MAEGFALADAFVRIRPTAEGFAAETNAKLRAAMASVASPEVKISANTAAAQLKVVALKTILDGLVRKIYSAQLVTEDTKFQAALSRDLAQLMVIDNTIATAEVDLLGAQKMEAQLLSIAAGLVGINNKIATAHIKVDDSDAERQLALLTVQLAALASKITQLRVDVDPSKLLIVEAMAERLAQITEQVGTIDFKVINTEQLAAAQAAFRKLENEVGAVMPAQVTRLRGYWGNFWGFMTTKVTLFGGLLGTVGIGAIAWWHILADAIIETIAVVGPAIVAFGAFAAAATDAATHVIQHLHAVMQVTQATGLAVAPFTNAFQQLGRAITPRVYELFGQVMSVVNDRMGLFSHLAMGAAQVLDQLGARATQAVLSSGFQTFLKNAITDLQLLGNIAGNLLGIFGNFLKMLTFWAHTLFTGLEIVTGAIERFTALPLVQTLGKWAVGFHGFWIWVGLLTTAVVGLIPWLAKWTGTAGLLTQKATGLDKVKRSTVDLANGIGIFGTRIKDVIPNLKSWASRMVQAGGAAEGAGRGTKLLSFAMGVAKSIGWGWVGIGAFALAGLVYWINTSKDSTQRWVDSMQSTIDRTSTWSNVTQTITAQLAKTNMAIAGVTRALNEGGQATGHYADAWRQASRASFIGGDTQIRELTGAQKQFQAELVTTGSRLGEMARRFGGLTQAIGLARIAGIKVTQLLHDNANAFALDLRQINGLVQGYKYMGVASGALGNAVKVLQFQADDQITAVNQLNQAWTAFFGIVSGGEQTFVAFAQAMGQIPHQAATSAQQIKSAQATVASAQNTLNNLQNQGTVSTNQLTAAQDRLRAARLRVAQADSREARISAQGSVASAQNTLNNLQHTGTASAQQLAAAQDHLAAAQQRLNILQGAGKASLTGLNQASLTLRQNWLQSITAAQNYYEALQTQSAAASAGAKGQELLYRAGEDLIRTLAPAARGSATLRQAVYALAQQFGISGTRMEQLITHAGSLRKNELDLEKVNETLAGQVSNLSRDWAAMATTLQSQVKSALDAVALKSSGAAYAAQKLYEALHQQGPASQEAHNWYQRLIKDLHNAGLTLQQARDYADAYTQGLGFNTRAVAAGLNIAEQMIGDVTNQKVLFGQVKTALDAYSEAVSKNSATSQAGQNARFRLINDLEAIGKQAHLSQGQIETMIGRILHLNRTQVKLLMTGAGAFTIRQEYVPPGQGGRTATSLLNPGRAGGGMISGGTHGRDSVAAMLMPGEVVVPEHMVRAGAVDHLRGHLPGFAKGGMAGSFHGGMLGATQWLSGIPGVFKNDMVSSMQRLMLAALKSAEATAAAVFRSGPSAFGGSSAAIAFARALLPAYGWAGQWPALFALWNRESGWNPYAVNPTSGAYGIPQSLGHGHPYALGDYANQIRWGLSYIRGRYGSPDAAWAHELAFGWYDRGGYLPRGLSLALNTSGRPERVSDAPLEIVLEVTASGGSEFEQFMLTAVRKWVRVRGGNVQAVLGRT